MATPTGTATPPAVAPPLLQGAGTPLPSQIPSRSAPGQNTGGVGTFGVKSGLAQLLKGGVIVEVVSAEQAKLAEEAGACAVMAVERLPADIRASGGVARMCDPTRLKAIIGAVTVPVMAKVRVGHFVEAQILQSLGIDYIHESETLTAADEQDHINKHAFKVPFACGVRDLAHVLCRVSEGAAFVHTLGDAGSGNVAQAVRHLREILADIRKVAAMNDEELSAYAASIKAPLPLLKETARLKRLPVVNFASGGVATPADAALLMQLGADGVVVGSGVFHSENPAKFAKAIVQAVTHYNNPKVLAEISIDLGKPMSGADGVRIGRESSVSGL